MDILALDTEQRQQVVEKLRYFYKGDELAVSLVIDLLFIGHLWDDLIDQDKPRTADDINRAFTMALGELPLNPYFPAVYHLIRNAMCQWEAANQLMTGNDDEKLMGFLIRNALMEIVFYMMFLTGGPAWIRENGPDFWKYFSQGMDNQFKNYLLECKNA